LPEEVQTASKTEGGSIFTGSNFQEYFSVSSANGRIQCMQQEKGVSLQKRPSWFCIGNSEFPDQFANWRSEIKILQYLSFTGLQLSRYGRTRLPEVAMRVSHNAALGSRSTSIQVSEEVQDV